MVFGTILTGGQQVSGDSGSPASAKATLGYDEAGALTYELTVVGLDFGTFIGDGIPLTADPNDDVTRIDFGNAPIGEVGDIAFGVVGVDGDDDLIFTSNPDGSTTISGIWEETDLASIPLSTFVPGLDSAVATTSENGAPQVSELYVNVSTVGDPEGAIRGQIASLPQGTYDTLLAIDPIALNALVSQETASI
jgi:hypothetical protein